MPVTNSTLQPDWDIFCTVVDHYGDAAISWRLAKQLALEYHQSVRLWIDDLTTLARLAPEIDPTQAQQTRHGVVIFLWQPATWLAADIVPARIVVEAFGYRLPEAFLRRLANQPTAPIWINLEYLSTEPWAQEYHGCSSPHPTLPLKQRFFFPGFSAGTGGVLAESDLLHRRTEFQYSGDIESFWEKQLKLFSTPLKPLRMPHPNVGLRISLFNYENPATLKLAEVWATGDEPIHCFISDPKTSAAIAPHFGHTIGRPGELWQDRQLHVWLLPFLNQAEYDQLLWSCDLNFVRGEDSFVRAQWAGIPFVWQAYPQVENAHWQKVEAFLRTYFASASSPNGKTELALQACTSLHQLWNLGHLEGRISPLQDPSAVWLAFRAALPELKAHQQIWTKKLSDLGDLAQNLNYFCTKLAQPQPLSPE